MIEVNFDDSEIAKNVNTILNASTQAQARFTQDGYQIIIQTAKIFSEKYQKMLNLISNFENAMKQTIKTWHAFKASCKENGADFKNTTQYDEYLKSRLEIRTKNFSNQIKKEILNTYELAMEFQEYLNAALGQRVVTAYVWVNRKGVPQTYVIHNMSDFLKVDIDRYGNVVVRYRNSAKLLREHAEKVQKSIQEDTKDFNYSLLKSTYKTAFDRYNGHKRSGGGAYVLWLYPGGNPKWNGVLVSSFGSINEAYTTLLLHQHFNATNVPEDNMEQFMNYVMKVTNLSGTLEGDTTVNNMQIAVKSNQATTLSIEQLYKMAQDIIKNKLNNFKAIQDYLVQKKKQNKNAQRAINVSLKDCLQDIADQNVGSTIQSIMK